MDTDDKGYMITYDPIKVSKFHDILKRLKFISPLILIINRLVIMTMF